MFFSLVRKERKGQKEESFPLLNTFCRLAATSANKVPRPSNYSIATATGSKRSSADSDLLLCHVRLWRTSRLSFWRKYGCEHSEIGFVSAIYCSNTSSVAVNRATFSNWRRLAKILAFVGAQAPPTPATHFSAGVQTMRARICSALSCDMFARVVWLKSWGAAKPPTFDLSLAACTRHAWLVRLTRARGRRYIRGRKALLYDFWYFWSCKSTIKREVTFTTFGHRKVR